MRDWHVMRLGGSRSSRTLGGPARRIVQTSNGPILLEIWRVFDYVSVVVSAFGPEGWELRSERLSWSEERPYNRSSSYREEGGRDSAAEAIEEAVGVLPAEAATIADESLEAWERHLDPDDAAQTATAIRVLILVALVVSFFVVGFFVLLVLLLV